MNTDKKTGLSGKKAKALPVYFLVGMGLGLVFTILFLALGSGKVFYAPAIFGVFMVFLYAILQRGFVRLSSALFSTAQFLTAVWMVLWTGGLMSPFLIWIGATVIIAGFLNGYRITLVASILSAIAVGLYANFFQEIAALNEFKTPVQQVWISVFSYIFSFALLAYVVVENYKKTQAAYSGKLSVIEEKEKLAKEHAAVSSQLSSREREETNRLKAETKTKEKNARENAAEFEKAAASLEEIARSVREVTKLTENVQNSSLEIKSLAEQGNSVVDRAIAQMKEIETSSDQISSILKIIEGISFQTNLLALNARVEAARAGAHGKGFAVVASEVQALAGRSAKAAQEITQLIEKETAQVKNGVEIVMESGVALSAIADKVYISDGMIAKLASSIHKQDAAAAQISETTQRLDQKMRGDVEHSLMRREAAE